MEKFFGNQLSGTSDAKSEGVQESFCKGTLFAKIALALGCVFLVGILALLVINLQGTPVASSVEEYVRSIPGQVKVFFMMW